MQKVEGSSPFSRFLRKTCKSGAFRALEQQATTDRAAEAGARAKPGQDRRAPALLALAVGAVLWYAGEHHGSDRRDPPTTQRGRVVKVADGDTMTVLSGGRRERVRVLGIDAPEAKARAPAKVAPRAFAMGGTDQPSKVNAHRPLVARHGRVHWSTNRR